MPSFAGSSTWVTILVRTVPTQGTLNVSIKGPGENYRLVGSIWNPDFNKTTFIQAQIYTAGWYSIKFEAAGYVKPVIEQVIVIPGNVSPSVQDYPNMFISGNDCTPDCNHRNQVCNYNLPNQLSGTAGSQYVVEFRALGWHPHANFYNSGNVCWEDSYAAVEIGAAKYNGWNLASPDNFYNGFASYSGVSDAGPIGARQNPMEHAYLDGGDALVRWIYTKATGNSEQVDVVYGKGPVVLYEVLIYPKPAYELFNMYYANVAPYATVYFKPLNKKDDPSYLNWINVQDKDIQQSAPGEVYVSASTSPKNGHPRVYGNSTSSIIIKKPDNTVNYLYTVSGGPWRRFIKVIFN